MKLFKQNLWIILFSLLLSVLVGCGGSSGNDDDDDDDTPTETPTTSDTFTIKDSRVTFGEEAIVFDDDGKATDQANIVGSNAIIKMVFDETGAEGSFDADVSVKLERITSGGTFSEITIKMSDVNFTGSDVSLSLPTEGQLEVEVTSVESGTSTTASSSKFDAFSASENEISLNLTTLSEQASSVLQGTSLPEVGEYDYTMTFGSEVTIVPNNILTGKLIVE